MSTRSRRSLPSDASPGALSRPRREPAKPKRFTGEEWVDPKGKAPVPVKAQPDASPSRKTPAKRRSAPSSPAKARSSLAPAQPPAPPPPPPQALEEEGDDDDDDDEEEEDEDLDLGGSEEDSDEEEEEPSQDIPLDPFPQPPAVSGLPIRRRARGRLPTAGDLSHTLRENLKRLKNLLKLPKARRWVFCEFFYSDMDRELFLGENEFSQCLRESFPNLKTRSLTRVEWSEMRRLIGKPRRCSAAFLEEERRSLAAKRAKVREIHHGAVMVLDSELMDLPPRIPEPLVVGAKVYARVRHPKDGIYSGIVDAVCPDGYRLTFDKDLVPPSTVQDFEVMSETPGPLVSLNFFLEKNKAAAPICARAQAAPTAQAWLSPSKVLSTESSPLIKYDPVMTAALGNRAGGSQSLASPSRVVPRGLGGPSIAPQAAAGLPGSKGDERVGNFPLRLLVMLVKLNKLMEIKRSLIRQISELNGEAERQNIVTSRYPREFQEKYAQLVVDLEGVNRQLGAYLSGIGEYEATLVPHLSEVTLTSRPETLRKLCHSHALQIVRQANAGLGVGNGRLVQLITSLTALLLQVRSLGNQGGSALDLNTLSDALAHIRQQIHPPNLRAFQDNVEVHMKHIHASMLQQADALQQATQ